MANTMPVVQCQNCSQELEVGGSGDFKCPQCAAEFHYDMPAGDGPLWEGERTVRSYWETLKKLITAPALFFQQVGLHERVGPSIWFGVISMVVGMIGYLGFQSIIAAFPALAALFFGGGTTEEIMGGLFSPLFFLGMLVFSPILALMGIFFQGAINQFFLWVFRIPNKGFDATIQLIAYANGINVLQLLPVFGQMAAGVWQIVLTIMGIKVVHDTTYGKATLVVLAPMLLVCCCVFALVFMVF